MSEKCPKCGAEVLAKTNGEVNTYITFKCGTSRLNDEDHRQSRDCHIAELEKKVERLMEALMPFAVYAKQIPDVLKDEQGEVGRDWKGPNARLVTVGDFRRASALLKGEKEGEGKI